MNAVNHVAFNKVLADALLYQLSAAEIHDYLDYYDHRIEALIDAGWSEKRAVAKQGDPRLIAQQILNPQLALRPKKKRKFLRLLLLIITAPIWGSCLLGIISVALACYLMIWCIPFIGACVTLAGILGGGVAVVFSPFLIVDFWGRGLIQLGVGLLMIGVGLIAACLTYYSVKYLLMAQRFIFIQIKHRHLAKKAVFG